MNSPDSNDSKLTLPVQLALLGAVIINMAAGVIHLMGFMFWDNLNVWTGTTVVVGVLAVFLSWQILQLINVNTVNYGFQLGGLWMVTAFILDFFLYLLPKPGTLTDTIAKLHKHLLIYYGVILFTPTLIGIIHSIRILREDQTNG